MRKIIQIVLALGIAALVIVMVLQIFTPVRFDREVTRRSGVVIERLKHIRSAQQSYKSVHGNYTGSFDTLIEFIMNDSMIFDKTIGSADDSLSNYRTEKFKMAVIDTIFGQKVTPEYVEGLRYIPYSEVGTEDGAPVEFMLAAGILQTVSGVKVPVFECDAPYKFFLADLDHQLLVNLIDDRKTIEKYPGIKVGDMNQATNDAGNWE